MVTDSSTYCQRTGYCPMIRKFLFTASELELVVCLPWMRPGKGRTFMDISPQSLKEGGRRVSTEGATAPPVDRRCGCLLRCLYQNVSSTSSAHLNSLKLSIGNI